MKKTFTLISFFFSLYFLNTASAQNILSISPNHAQEGETFTADILGQNNVFAAITSSSDVILSSGFVSDIYCNAGTVVKINNNHITAQFTIPYFFSWFYYPFSLQVNWSGGGSYLTNSFFVYDLVSISPNVASQGQVLTATITGQEHEFIDFTPNTYFFLNSSPNFWNFQNGYTIVRDSGTVNLIDDSHITAQFHIPQADTGLYTLYIPNLIDYADNIHNDQASGGPYYIPDKDYLPNAFHILLLSCFTNVSPISICSGQSGTLTASGGATTYSWSPSIGLSATTGVSVTANPTITTTYSVTGSSSGCTNNTTVVVTVSHCSTPTNISISNITGTKATINWIGNDCAVKYRIQYRIQGATAWSVTLVNAPTLSKTLINLQSNTTYQYRIRTDCNSNGSIGSAYSPISSFTTICGCPLPANISSSAITQTSATVNWTGSVCAYQYRLQYRKQGVTAWTTKTILAPANTKTLTGLTANTIYEYKLRTDCNSSGTINSGFSSIHTFTTALRLEDTNAALVVSEFTISPNPCSTCEIISDVNSNDLILTDIVGRIVPVNFDKTSNGYQINFMNDETGFFIIRSKKTGQVVKFVRE